jgi:putative membrane protein
MSATRRNPQGLPKMKFSAVAGTAVGIALSAWLLETYGVERILGLLGDAGATGMIAVIAFHFVQILFSAAAWRVILGKTEMRPTLRQYMVLRWIREGVNNLLPVAQIGGEFVAARLLHRRGVKLAPAIAGTVADLTMEMITQIGFTLLGLLLLVVTVGGGSIGGYVASGLGVAVAVAAGFLGAQWFGLALAIETGLIRLGRAMQWRGVANVAGLHEALKDCYRQPRRIALAALWHMVSWLLGGLEVMLALHFLGHEIGFTSGLIIESVGQALKALGFAVPGALGVQEGGYIIICGVFGLSPEVAIALSLIKRLREAVLGVPGLLAWQRMEAKGKAAPAPGIAP